MPELPSVEGSSFRDDRLALLKRAGTHAPVVRLELAGQSVTLLNQPQLVGSLMDATGCDRDLSLLELFLGRELLEGDVPLQALEGEPVQRFAPAVIETTDLVLEGWRPGSTAVTRSTRDASSVSSPNGWPSGPCAPRTPTR